MWFYVVFFLTRKPHEDNGVEITFWIFILSDMLLWFFKRVCPDKSFVLITSLVFTMMYNNNLLQKLQL